MLWFLYSFCYVRGTEYFIPVHAPLRNVSVFARLYRLCMTSKINLAKRSRLWGSAAPSARAASGAARGRERELCARTGGAPSGREAEGSPVKTPTALCCAPRAPSGSPLSSVVPSVLLTPGRRPEGARFLFSRFRGSWRCPSAAARSHNSTRGSSRPRAAGERSREGSACPVGALGHRPRRRSAPGPWRGTEPLGEMRPRAELRSARARRPVRPGPRTGCATLTTPTPAARAVPRPVGCEGPALPRAVLPRAAPLRWARGRRVRALLRGSGPGACWVRDGHATCDRSEPNPLPCLRDNGVP